ncbi:hypothetical protein YN1HA_25980 [Sulfurisphaera ohwakuensis]
MIFLGIGWKRKLSKLFMEFLGGKVPPKSTVFYKRLQQTVFSDGETMRSE